MKHLSLAFIIIVLMTPLASCARNYPVKPSPPSHEVEVFYSIGADGTISAVDAKGNKIPLKRVEIPFKREIHEIQSLKQITILELKGSHFTLICPSPHYCYLH